MIEDEKFFAWLDGELNADEASAVERQVLADPRLSRLAEQHHSMQAKLKQTFDSVADAPVPQRLRNAASSGGVDVLEISTARQHQPGRYRASLPQWAAMAATLAVGILVGTMIRSSDSNAPIQVHDGKVYAASGLQRVLTADLASAPSGNAVRIGITYRDQTGAICRSFTGPRSTGLACKDSNGWQVRGLFEPPEGQSEDYRMAAGMNPGLAALVDSTMVGEPFDAAQEKAAKEKGWR